MHVRGFSCACNKPASRRTPSERSLFAAAFSLGWGEWRHVNGRNAHRRYLSDFQYFAPLPRLRILRKGVRRHRCRAQFWTVIEHECLSLEALAPVSVCLRPFMAGIAASAPPGFCHIHRYVIAARVFERQNLVLQSISPFDESSRNRFQQATHRQRMNSVVLTELMGCLRLLFLSYYTERSLFMLLPKHLRFPTLGALLFGCALLPVRSSAQLSFPSHQIAQSTNGALDVVAHGDFNGDGREDLLVMNFVVPPPSGPATFTYKIFLSNGNGTFDAPKALPAKIGDYVTTVGDFNHDGKLDFATVNASYAIVVFLGNGDGTFQAGKTVTSNTNTIALVAADLNHDNKTDLVQLVNGPNPFLQLWISNGNGTFAKGQTIAVYNPNFSGFLNNAVTGDFDGDGKPDIALIYSYEGPTSIQVWYGNGSGHLGSPVIEHDVNGYEDFNL